VAGNKADWVTNAGKKGCMSICIRNWWQRGFEPNFELIFQTQNIDLQYFKQKNYWPVYQGVKFK
jgi:hypothetical protein